MRIPPSAEAPVPVVPVVPVSEEPVVHSARCDVCDVTISGIRHKCRNCPDYDMVCFYILTLAHADDYRG